MSKVKFYQCRRHSQANLRALPHAILLHLCSRDAASKHRMQHNITIASMQDVSHVEPNESDIKVSATSKMSLYL